VFCLDAKRWGWCPLCYEGLRHRRTHKGHHGYRQPKKGRDDVALRIVRAGRGEEGASGGAARPVKPSAYFKTLPVLWEFLTTVVWDDGERRTTGTVLYFFDEGRLKACLSDRDSDRVAFVTAGTWEELQEAIDAGLADGSLDWRQSSRGRAGARKG